MKIPKASLVAILLAGAVAAVTLPDSRIRSYFDFTGKENRVSDIRDGVAVGDFDVGSRNYANGLHVLAILEDTRYPNTMPDSNVTGLEMRSFDSDSREEGNFEVIVGKRGNGKALDTSEKIGIEDLAGGAYQALVEVQSITGIDEFFDGEYIVWVNRGIWDSENGLDPTEIVRCLWDGGNLVVVENAGAGLYQAGFKTQGYDGDIEFDIVERNQGMLESYGYKGFERQLGVYKGNGVAGTFSRSRIITDEFGKETSEKIDQPKRIKLILKKLSDPIDFIRGKSYGDGDVSNRSHYFDK